MDLIKTGIGISKTIRNVARLREIVLVFAKHGFDEFISRGVISSIPHFVLPKSHKSIKSELKREDRAEWGQVLGHRLRLCFEELGPTFIKFGQLLSSREDLFDQAFISEMKILRDRVRPIPFSSVRLSVEKSLGQSTEEIFSQVNEEPIGTASIGVVYRGVLKNGEEVVLKYRRPKIEREIETDFSLLNFLVLQAEKVSLEVKHLGLSRIINDFSFSLINELNFHAEALNAKRFRQILKKYDVEKIFTIPKIYSDYSRNDLLVMEYLQGIPFSDGKALESHRKDLSLKLNEGLKIFIKTFLQEGYFHADLHGGNFFLLSDGKIGLIDFGLMGSLSKRSRKSFMAIIYAMLTFNYENLVLEFLDVAEYGSIPDVDGLIIDVRDSLSPFIGLTVQQTDFSMVIKSIIETLRKHQIFLPREWFMFFRGLIALDGVGRSLHMDFDIYTMMEGDIYQVINDSFSKEELLEEGVWAARDFLSLGRTIPRHLKWFLKDWSKKGYAHELILKGHQRPLREIDNSLAFLGFCLLTSVFMISGVIFLGKIKVETLGDIPTFSWIFWGIGGIFLSTGLWSLGRKGL